MAGRSINLTWKKPGGGKNEDPTEYFNEILSYQIVHDFPGAESPIIVSGATTSYVFENVPIGTYFVAITAFDSYNKRTEPFVRKIEVLNDYLEEIPRLTLNVPYGGSSTSPLIVTGDGIVRFEKPSYKLTPKHPKAKATINDSLVSSTYSQSVANITAVSSDANLVIDPTDLKESFKSYSFLLHQASEATDKIKLIQYREQHPEGFGYASARWYDAGTGNTPEKDDYVTVSTGSFFRNPFSSKIEGDGTSFSSHFAVGDTIKCPVDRNFLFTTTANSHLTARKEFRFQEPLGFCEKGLPVVYDNLNRSAGSSKTANIGDLVFGTTYFLEPLTTSGCSFNVAVHTTQSGALNSTSATRVSFTTNNDGSDTRAFKATNILTPQGVINHIESAEVMYVDNFANPYTVQSQSAKRAGLRINRVEDTIIGAIAKKSDGSYFLTSTLDKVSEDENTRPPISASSAVPGKFLHYFPTNTTINGKLTDTVGNATGSVEGSGFSISDDSIIGKSLALTGNTGVQLLTDAQADSWMQTTSSWTATFWAKSEKNDSTNTDPADDARMISRDRSEFFALQMDQGSSQEVRLDYRNSSGVSSVSVISHSSKDEWHHYAITYDKTTLKVYVDGLFETSVTNYAPNYAESRPLGLGANVETAVEETSPSSAAFVGKFTEIRLYTRDLTEGEILGLYHLPGASNDTAVKDNTTVLGDGTESIKVTQEGIYLGNTTIGDAPFSVTPQGAIKATSGEIGGWNLSASALFSGASADTDGYTNSGITIYGGGSIHTPQFYVDTNGNAKFKGELSACSGTIGGWNMTGSALYAGDLTSGEVNSFNPTGFIESNLTDTENAIILHSQGSLHSKNFFINSDGSSGFKGDIGSATGQFLGSVGDQSVTSDSIVDGSINTDEIGTEAVAGYNISPSGTISVFSKSSTGSVIASSFAALDGADADYRIYAGSNSPGAAPFRVTKEGKVIADNLQFFDADNNVYFDSINGGLTDSALTQIAKDTGTRVSKFSEAFTGNASNSNASTFEKVVVTDSTTDLSTTIKIPLANISVSASEEYFGTRSNPLKTSLDTSAAVIGSTGTENLSSTNILKPSGAAIGRALKVGEIVRLDLFNTIPGMALKSVVGAKNNATGSDFASTTTVPSPATKTSFIFEIDSTETFKFTISSKNTADISMSSSSVSVAKPDTETAARARIMTSIQTGLKRSVVSAEGTATDVLPNRTFTRVTSGTPTTSEFLAKTLSKDVVGADSIQTNVAIVEGGAIDSQGYLTRSTHVATNISASSYFFHSTLTVTGGDSSIHPSTRLFEAGVGADNTGFIVNAGGTVTQSSQAALISDMTLSGDISGSDNMTLTPGTNSGTFRIDGNLVVTGTQTTSNVTDLTVTNKKVTVAQGADDDADAHLAGLSVDRTGNSQVDAEFLWNQTGTNANSWVADHALSSSSLKILADGDAAAPGLQFKNRSKTGIYASTYDTTGTQLNLTVRKSVSDTEAVSYVNYAGLWSSKNVYTGADGDSVGQFRAYDQTWKASTNNANNDFQFLLDGTAAPILHMDTGNLRVGINTAAPDNTFHVSSADTGTIGRFATTGDTNFLTLVAAKRNSLVLQSPNSFYLIGQESGSGSSFQILRAPSATDSTELVFEIPKKDTASPTSKAGRVVIHSDLYTEFRNSSGYYIGPNPHTATLTLRNENSSAYLEASTHKAAASISFETKQDTFVVQRGYISCAADASATGYGIMLLGATRLPDDDMSDGSRSFGILALKGNEFGTQGNVGINCKPGTSYALDISTSGVTGQTSTSPPLVRLHSYASATGDTVASIYIHNKNKGKSLVITSEHEADHSNNFILKNNNVGDSTLRQVFKITGTNGTVHIGRHFQDGYLERGTAQLNILDYGIDRHSQSFSASEAVSVVKDVFSWGASLKKALKLFVSVEASGEYTSKFACELLILSDVTSPGMTEYAVITNNTTKCVEFSVATGAGNTNKLQVTNKVTGLNKVIKVAEHSFT